MKLTDEILDLTAEVVKYRLLPVGCSDAEIVNEISKQVGIPLALNSTGAKLAIAQYRRLDVEGLVAA
jgi:hypothetical protein